LRANPKIEQVIVADNLDPLCGGNPVGLEIELCDVRKESDVEDLMRNADAVIHLAAYGRNLTCQDRAQQAWAVNVGGTMNILEVAARQRKRVVVCSSNIVLSDQWTVYKVTKKACEGLVKSHAEVGLLVMALRPSNIYGAGQSKTEYQLCAFAGLDKSYAEKGKFFISGDGTQSRDWVHAADVARAFELALFSDVRGRTLDVCTGKLTSMNDIAKMLGVPVEYTAARPGDAKELVSDPYPAEQLLGFKAELDLEDHIRDAFPSLPCLTQSS
jgi:UDP-glucose 4-epimerase